MSRAQVVDDARLSEFVGQFGLDMDEGGDGRKYVDTISLCGNREITLEEGYFINGSPGTWPHFYAMADSYFKWKGQFGYMDFCDMLKNYRQRARIGSGHGLLVIDEAQDLTPLHWAVIHKIRALNPDLRVIVGGDSDQTLFEYGGADAQGMRKFMADTGADLEVLKQSYRVPIEVHGLAMQVIERVQDRLPVEYLPRPFAGNVYTMSEFKAEYLNPKRESLVIFNDKFVRQKVEEALIENAIPYEAVSGFPAPMQTKAGKALRIAHKVEITQDDMGQLKKALNDKGKAVFDSIGYEAVVDQLLEGNYSCINVHWSNREYFGRVDWTQSTTVKIATLHGSKGMESDDVHLLLDQSQAAIDYSIKNPDAQHRLMYVGITRAKERLFTYDGEQGYELP